MLRHCHLHQLLRRQLKGLPSVRGAGLEMPDLSEAAVINSVLCTGEVGVAFHFTKQDSLSWGLSVFPRVTRL